MMKTAVMAAALLAAAAGSSHAAEQNRRLVVTASNETTNRLLVYDTSGALVQAVPTQGQGGVDGNAGGIATWSGRVAVVNPGSQDVSIFSQAADGFVLEQIVPAASQPLSVAVGHQHLYVLGTTTVESHRMTADGIEPAADGTSVLAVADGSAAQIGVAGDVLVISEKTGAVEVVRLQSGAAQGTATPVALPAGANDTPFGLITRGANAYVTVAHSDAVAVVNTDRFTSAAFTGEPNGAGEHSPCWIAVAGPYLFTSNSPSHSLSRLIAAGRNVVLDDAAAARTTGVPIDITANGNLLALVETNDGGGSHLTQYWIADDGSLTPIVSTSITSVANGVAIVPVR